MTLTTEDRLPVLDKGYVRLEDRMGDDLTVVNRARSSFNRRSTKFSERDRKLMADLVAGTLTVNGTRVMHWSPFSHPHVMIEVSAPVMVVRHWYKTAIASAYAEDMHSWNEVSRRYVTLTPEFHRPDVWRAAPEHKKQGSAGPLIPTYQEQASSDLDDVIALGQAMYDKWLARGMAPEQARGYLPYAFLYTSFSWTCSLGTVLRWLLERLADDAQDEIRQYAEAVRTLVAPLFPESFAAHGLGVVPSAGAQ